MDHYARFSDIIQSVTFRDWRWILGVHNERTGGLGGDGVVSTYYLQVEFDAPDSTTGEPALQRGRKWFLSPHMTRSEVVQTAWAAVHFAVEHEAREDFRYRGEAVYSPHFDVDRLHRLAVIGAFDTRATERPMFEDGGGTRRSDAP